MPESGSAFLKARRFLALPEVRARMTEYLGARTLAAATASFVAAPTPLVERLPRPLAPTALDEILDCDLEVARSLWDRASLLVHLDIEHVSFDEPWAPLVELERSAALQAPVVRSLLALLRGYGIEPLHLLTGRGHHLVWRVRRGSRVVAELSRLGRLDAEERRSYREHRPPHGEPVGAVLGAAQKGLGKVLEHLGHRLLQRVEGLCEVPVELVAVVVGPGPSGREIVSVDLSQFGDPLWARSIRVPFSLYRKPALLGAPPELADRVLVAVPVPGGDLERASAARSDLDRAAALAASSSTAIPRCERGMERLVWDYRGSRLAAVHRRYERVETDPPERWLETYDRLDLDSLPACVRRPLEEPNDLLLQPACIQLVVRTLVAQGWEPRHVAGLLRSRYERDHGWIRGLHFDEPAMRAEFYTRLFAGMVATGSDPLVDLNCVSTQEKALCPGVPCGWDLRTVRAALLEAGG